MASIDFVSSAAEAVCIEACGVQDEIAFFVAKIKHLPPPIPKASNSELRETGINEFFM